MVKSLLRFPSLSSLRDTHGELLRRHRELGNTPEFLAEIDTFIREGRALGALLDADEDRWVSQDILDYWANMLYSVGYMPPDTTLVDFDVTLAPELPDALCPYLGLEAFQEGNHDLFFGRQRLIEELLDKLKEHRLLPVVGSSGAGKSSLVLAGLLPALRASRLPGS
ncbi:MAG: hypothetical protein L0Y56_16475, partial [Nitrospira sp.]|nr:hypothetical protein [Nitrospira sp.]